MSKQSNQRYRKELEKETGTKLDSDYKVSDTNKDKYSNNNSNNNSNSNQDRYSNKKER